VEGAPAVVADAAQAPAVPAAPPLPIADLADADAALAAPLEIAPPAALAEPITAEIPAAPAPSPQPEPDPVVEEAPAALAEDATPAPAAPAAPPAWVVVPAPQEVEPHEVEPAAQPEVMFALEDTQPMAALRAAAIEAAAQSAPEPEAPAEDDPAPEVATVDRAAGYDEIVVTDEPAAGADQAPKPVIEPRIQTPPVPVDVPAAESPALAAERELPTAEHAAYEEYLRDSQAPFQPPVEELDEAAAEGQITAAQEPVAHIDASGDVQIEMDTRNAHVWNELGNVYFNSGAFDDAVAAYTRAIELDRWFAWPYSNLALAYMQKGRFAEAILLYQRSIELFTNDKDKAISWNRLGNVYRRLNDYDNAIAAYQRADELDPDNATLSLQSRFSLLGSFSVEPKPSFAA
jgi:tetratricopeptide (TPR) repeat protein